MPGTLNRVGAVAHRVVLIPGDGTGPDGHPAVAIDGAGKIIVAWDHDSAATSNTFDGTKVMTATISRSVRAIQMANLHDTRAAKEFDHAPFILS